MGEPAIVVDDLTVRHGTVLAVDGVSFAAQAGAVTALLGPNGAGKTSTVEVIAGQRRASSGRVHVLGHDPWLDATVKARVGVMPQAGGLYPTARPLEWLRYLARLYPNPGDPMALLDLVGIDPSTRTTSRRLSGGEQQRVKMAAALLPNPAVLLLDEPTAGLDPLARRGLLDIIGGLTAQGVAILLTTHLLPDVEELADRVVILGHGRVREEGSLTELTGAHQALTFRGPRHLSTDALASALPEGYRVDEPTAGRYVVHGTPTPQIMAAVAAWCAQHGVLATDLSIGQRTLEEILVEAAEGQG